MPQDQADETIVQAFLAGDQGAAKQIEKYVRAALRPWQSGLGYEADDVLSDVWFELLEEFRKEPRQCFSNLKGFVRQVVNHTAIDYRRFRQRVKVVDPDTVVLQDHRADPEEELARKRQVEEGMRVVRRLSEVCRRIWRMRLVEGKSCREIGQILGTSEGAVRQKIFACRESAKRIREKIKKGDKRL